MGIVENTYAELKQQELKNNPYSCLHMADIDINPHQVEAFTFALSSLELGGAILADEVDAVFEIIDITGKIYGVSDDLARNLCEKLQEQCLEEKTPNNQEILSYIDKVDEFMQQKYAESKRTVLIANQKKLDNWLQSRKEEYLLTVKDTSEIDELKEKYAIEGDFRQKIALKKQIEILEEQKQKMIEAFHDEMSALEEEAANMQKQFAEGIVNN